MLFEVKVWQVIGGIEHPKEVTKMEADSIEILQEYLASMYISKWEWSITEF